MMEGLPIYQPGDTLQCIYCDEPYDPLERGPDHIVPQALVGHSRARAHREFVDLHPASPVVYSSDNLQCVCPPRHAKEDLMKLDKLLGIKRPKPGIVLLPDLSNPFRGNPVGVMEYMICDFKPTDHPLYFEQQRNNVRETMKRLARIGRRMRPAHLMRLLKFYPGGYTRESRERYYTSAQVLSRRYNEAAGLAFDYSRYLGNLSSPPKVFAFPKLAVPA